MKQTIQVSVMWARWQIMERLLIACDSLQQVGCACFLLPFERGVMPITTLLHSSLAGLPALMPNKAMQALHLCRE